MDIEAELDQIWQNADCLLDRQQIERSIEQVAQRIESDLGDASPLVLVVMRGGMIFGASLVMQLRFPLELDYIHVTRYGMETVGSDLHWKVAPSQAIQGRHVLIVDDIFDEGETLNRILENCRSLGAASVRSAVLVNKEHDRKRYPDFMPDYVCLNIQDRFVFGYGMDYKGYLRNVDGIFAVRES